MVSKMAVFETKIKGLNIKYSQLDPQKALTYPDRRHLTILRKNPFRDVRCSFIEKPNKERKN